MYRDHKISNDDRNPGNMAIALPESLNNTQLYNGDGRVKLKAYTSKEEERIDTLCDGIKLDLEVGYQISEACKNTKFELHLLPFYYGNVRHANLFLREHNKCIIIHETSSGVDYADPHKTSNHYIDFINKANNTGDNTGYHFLCDSNRIICFLPWNEVAYHAGSLIYNSRGIGIERIVTQDAGVDAIYNQAKLTATLMYMEDIPIHKVMTHFDANYARRLPQRDEDGNFIYDENGEVVYYLKSCPDRLIHGQFGGLLAFRQVVVNCLRTGDLYLKELEYLKKQIRDEDAKALEKLHIREVKDYRALVQINSKKTR